MINTKGQDTSILFGFTKYILELIQREKPTHIAVALDPPAKTFRHEMYPEYKGNRSATPEQVKAALEPIIEILKALNIPTLMITGYEADDVIGAMVKKYTSADTQTYMVTPDKDYAQLVGPNAFQYKPGKGGAEAEILGTKEICEKYSIQEPSQVIDILAIWGDASDNVPGVKGIGEVGAKKLIAKYSSVENILSNINELTNKQAAAFKESHDNLILSKQLVSIKTDIALEWSLEDCKLNVSLNSTFEKLIHEYQMNSLLNLLQKTAGTPQVEVEQKQEEFKYIDIDLKGLKLKIDEGKAFGFNVENGTIFLSFGEFIYVCKEASEVKDLFEDESTTKIGYNIKASLLELKSLGIKIKGKLADIEIMHYLINPESSHRFETLVLSTLGVNIELLTSNNKSIEQLDLFSSSNSEEPSCNESTKLRTALLYSLYEGILDDFNKDESRAKLYEEIEMPLIEVLSDMEQEGFRIDTALLLEFSAKLTQKALEIEAEIRDEVQDPSLNISSPKQLGILLFEKLKLDTKAKKTSKGSYSTDEETLTALKDRSPIIGKILEYRTLKKLTSTYIDPLPKLINPKSGNIHTTFNQSLTATGRLSSSKPNLQNIPIRSELGKDIRRAFISSHPDGYIVSADYSQIELRIMAALSKDPALIEAFKEGKDVHSATAANIFKVDESEVNSEQRRQAKMANFGIIYGISSFGLSQRLEIPRNEAKILIEKYMEHYSRVQEYIEATKERAHKQEYVETIFHRKRYLPDINSRNHTVRAFAERNAVNAPIQGSSADIIKLAMINIAKSFKEKGLKSKMILQVHDELVFDVVAKEKEIVLELVKYEMENVIDLEIPLTVDCNAGKNWLEAH